MRFNNKGCDAAQSSPSKGKEMMAIDLSGEAPPKKKRNSTINSQEFKFSPR